VRIKFVGDWLPGSSPSLDLKSDDCLWVGNLECAFSDAVIESGKAYISLLPLEYVDNNVIAPFSALSLANNHVYDAGGGAFDRMVEQLSVKCPKTQFFGMVEHPYADLLLDGRHVAVIGCLEPCRSRGVRIFRQEDVLALIRRIRDDFDFVYVFPHWGKEGEYTHYPAPWQLKLARRWIDGGADGVFGGHSHVFQGREFYKGKPIYYSLGNFHFPHPESNLYQGTDVGLCVEIKEGKVEECFVRNGVLIEDAAENKHLNEMLESISKPLKNWTTWKWARAVGPFNLKKNTASWKIRLKKNFIKTIPKFLVWQILPKTVLFRIASYMAKRRKFAK